MLSRDEGLLSIYNAIVIYYEQMFSSDYRSGETLAVLSWFCSVLLSDKDIVLIFPFLVYVVGFNLSLVQFLFPFVLHSFSYITMHIQQKRK